MRLQSCSSNPLVDAAYNAEEGDAGCAYSEGDLA